MLKDSVGRIDFDVIDEHPFFCEENYDFVFIYVKEQGTFPSSIRAMFPSSEFFIVSETRDYDIALSSLRVSARDILPSSFTKEDVVLALEIARVFRKKEREAQRYLDLAGPLGCIGDIKKLKTFESVFAVVKKYALNHFPVSRVGAFRYHKIDHSKNFDFQTQGEVLLSDEELSRLSVENGEFCREKFSHVYLPFFQEEDETYFLLLETLEGFELSLATPILETLISVLKTCYGYIRTSRSEERMSFLAHTDDVTGLYNQRRLFKDIDANIAQAQDKNSCFSLIFVDVDKFKNVNDEYGHIIGSKLLMQIAGVIRQVIRETDYILSLWRG